MSQKSPSRVVKRRDSHSGINRLINLLFLRGVYSAICILLLANGLFFYSVLVRIRGGGNGVSKEKLTFQKNMTAGNQTIRVEVLNGSGVEGIARRMTEFLRRQGFDVIAYGNAEQFCFFETVVLDRIGNRTWAEMVAQAVNTGNVLEQKNPFLTLDVTLILGRDFKKLNPFQQERRE